MISPYAKSQRGQSLAEYALVLGLAVLVLSAGAEMLRDSLAQYWQALALCFSLPTP